MEACARQWKRCQRGFLDAWGILIYFPAVDYHDVVTIEPGKRGRKQAIRGLRIMVQEVMEYLAGGMSEDEILTVSRTSLVKTSGPVLRPLPIASAG